MARVTVEDCIDKVENRFELVLLASHRARLISSGAPLTIDRDRDKNPVVALREIADETIAAGRPQGGADPLAAEICRGRRARSRNRSAAQPDCGRAAPAPMAAATGSADDSEVTFDRMSEEDLLRGLEGLVPPAESDDEGLTPRIGGLRKPGSAGLFCAHSPRFACDLPCGHRARANILEICQSLS